MAMKFQKIGQMSDSDDDLVDSNTSIHTLSHYVDNEEKLVEELFSIMKQKKIRAMLPNAFQSFSLPELKKLFLHELAGMSRARIIAAINGEEVNLSSSSESELSDSDYRFSSDDSYSKSDRKITKNNESKASVNLNIKGEDTNRYDEEDDSKIDPDLKEMDLIELEMRHKIIKTLLERQPNDEALLSQLSDPNFDISKIKIKEEPMSPPPIKIKQEKITPPSSRSSSRSSRSKSSKSSSSSSKSDSSSSSKSSDEEQNDKRKKKKLTREEFSERMKKAKMNRSYREKQNLEGGYDSEEEERKNREYRKWKKSMQKKLDKQAAIWEKEYFKKLKKETKPKEKIHASSELKEGEFVREKVDNDEDEEKEEGEVESNEEGEIMSEKELENVESDKEEGACSSSDEHEEDGELPDENIVDDIPVIADSPIGEEISQYPLKGKISKIKSNIEMEMISEDSMDKSKSENSQPTSLPSMSERQSISFSFSKKPNVATPSDSPKEKDDSDDEWSKLKECSPTENIEIIGEEDPDDLDNKTKTTDDASDSKNMEPGEVLEDEQNEPEDALEANYISQDSTEIIGTIEVKDGAEPTEDEIAGTWSARWLQSEKVQTVVSSSKILSKVRKKIQAKGKLEKPATPVPPPVVEKPQHANVIASVAEYTKLTGAVPKPKSKIPVGLGSDSDDSDDEIWSKIMKK